MFITLSTVNKKRGVQKLKSLDCVCDSQPFTQLLRYSLGVVKKKKKKKHFNTHGLERAPCIIHVMFYSLSLNCKTEQRGDYTSVWSRVQCVVNDRLQFSFRQ